jgi:hypothetical protein
VEPGYKSIKRAILHNSKPVIRQTSQPEAQRKEDAPWLGK